MMKRSAALLCSVCLLAALPSAVNAQGVGKNVLVLRKAMPTASSAAQTGSGSAGGGAYKWITGTYVFSSSCSAAAPGTRTVQCAREDNPSAVVADSFCSGITKPPSTTTMEITSGCPTTWVTGTWTGWSTSCGADAFRTRTVQCQKVLPSVSVTVANSNCSISSAPATLERSANYTGCMPAWQYGAWGWNGTAGAKSSSCSTAPQQNRTANCFKTDINGQSVQLAAAQCASLPPPTTTQTLSADLTGCSYSWTYSDWSAWTSTCSSSASRSRTATCNRRDPVNGNSTSVGASECSGIAKEAISETSANFTNCQNLIADPGFETYGLVTGMGGTSTDWKNETSNQASITYSGAYAGQRALFIPASTSAVGSRSFTAASSGNFSYSGWCKRLSNGQLSVSIVNSQTGTAVSGTPQFVTCGTSWGYFSGSVSLTGGTSYKMRLTTTSTSATALVDEITVKQN